jgi:hypothetical protein
VFVVTMAVALAECLASFSGVGPITPYRGTQCPTVLVTGTAWPTPIAQLLTAQYAASGLRSTRRP